jgi:hypothetical protein
MLKLIIGAIISILTSAAVAIFVEFMRRPRLKLSIETPTHENAPPPQPIREMRTVRVWVSNETLPGWAKWMERAPALQCRATISFHHLDGQKVFERAMEGRWAGSLEPVTLPVVGPEGQQFEVLDFARLTLESRMDIYPGQTQLLDIANRPDDDEVCYGWNNEAYFSTPRWRNPKWQLPKGRYLVKIAIGSSGQQFTDCFRLRNDMTRKDFRLEPANRDEKDRVVREGR